MTKIDNQDLPSSAPSQWFESFMEVAVSVLPLVLVVLGIGMMSFTPSKSTTPLFHSPDEAQAFFNGNGMAMSFTQPIVLISSSCASCKELTDALTDIHAPYVVQNIDSSTSGAALHTGASKVSGSEALPQVILGDQLVTPRAYAVKVALRRFSKTRAQ
jgi:glutaredoxin